MASLSISLQTEYLPSQMSNIDIYMYNNNNVNENHFRIVTAFEDHLNFREGVVLTKFGRLHQGQDYTCILRVFLKEAPYIDHARILVVTREEDGHARIRLRADV